MFCSNCGKEIPNDIKFCSHCGYEQKAYNVQPSQQATSASATMKQPKPKKNKWIPIIVGLVVFVIARGVIAPMITNSYTKNDNNTESERGVQSVTDNAYNSSTENFTSSPSSSYSEIFLSRNIITVPPVFFGLESATFATVDSAGMVTNEDFGYKDDIVKEWVTTFYIPKTVYSEIDLSEFTRLDALDFCTVTNSSSTNYNILTMNLTNLDNIENVQKLAEFNMITNNQNAISMKKTEKERLANGYVKK